MKNTKDLLKKILIPLVAAAVLCGIASTGLLKEADGVVSDAFYQSEQANEVDITVVGIDERAFELLGPWPWSRNVMAEVLEYLNHAAPEDRPAAIGIDVLFVGPGADPEADRRLAAAAAEAGNVVTVGSAVFGSEVVEEGDSFYLADRQVLDWEAPYPDLAAVTETGHINTMEDEDAVMRHALLYVDVPEQPGPPENAGKPGSVRVEALSRILYEKWCGYRGEEPKEAPETADGFFYIPFTREPGGYWDDVSVADLLTGAVPPEFFAGKIVLIGPYAPALQDDFRTSIAHAEPMYGVEVHANLIDAYQRGIFPREVGKGLQLVVLFIVSSLLMFFFHDRKIPPSVGAWLLTCALWCGIAKLLYGTAGAVLHVLWIPLAATVLFVVSVALNYVRSQRERRRVTNTFGHYVDPAVMKQLLEQGSSALELGGKLYDIAVLFVDVRGFTTMSEALDPPTVVEIINKYLTLTTECIMKNHGTLDKFVGDCTMALWNAPVEQEDPVYLACCAAMDMVEGSKALGEELMERFGRSVEFGIGVNYGPAVVGNIGAPKRMDYTAIGDTVNTAARLEANAPGGKVLISRVVANALGSRAQVTSLGDSIRLKGKAAGFEILMLDHLERK